MLTKTPTAAADLPAELAAFMADSIGIEAAINVPPPAASRPGGRGPHPI